MLYAFEAGHRRSWVPYGEDLFCKQQKITHLLHNLSGWLYRTEFMVMIFSVYEVNVYLLYLQLAYGYENIYL
jgi:hypothetical protein